MTTVKRFCSLTRSLYSFYSLQTSTLNRATILTSPKRFDCVRQTSSLTPLKQGNETAATNSDEERQLKLQTIHLEISLLREKGGKAPDVNSIKEYHWDELLRIESTSGRRKYYAYLFASERAKANYALKRQRKKELKLATQPLRKDPHINYSLRKTSLMMRIDKPVMNAWRNGRLFQAMQFGPKLVFDCSYDQHMTNREAKNAAIQLALSFGTNRKNREPFDIRFCNVNFNGELMKHLERNIPTMRNATFPMNFYEGSYLDLFPHEQLVYLTPHCQDSLTRYDPNMIYIVGAMVDKSNHEPLSLAKAKQLNLKMAQLPLDDYLKFKNSGDKSLTLDQMTNIMLDLKKTQNWEMALKHVPKRKLLITTHQAEDCSTKQINSVDELKETMDEEIAYK